MMERVNQLLADEEYKRLLERLEKLEENRRFCRHGLEHLLDVARIAWIWNLEEGFFLEKEDVYLSALLHDLGRVEEYEKGIPHHEAGKQLAAHFLEKLEYPKERQEEILRAVEGHRKKEEQSGLSMLLAKADKASRNCRYCKAYQDCKWSREEKERRLER